MEIKVLRDILSANDRIADENRKLLDERGIFTVNLMSSPGAGKTSLILKTIERLGNRVKIGVIEGDVSSSVDAEAIGKTDTPVIQINTGGGCHLDANMTHDALRSLRLQDLGLLFIENVGNLICPANFRLGEHRKVLISSIAEGDDKPLKYPPMYHKVDLVVLNKIDLLPYLKFDRDLFSDAVIGLNEKVKILPASCASGEGLDGWISWLLEEMKTVSKPASQA